MTPRVRQYAAEVAQQFGVTASQILSEKRGTPEASAALHVVMRRLRADGFTLNQIGGWLGRSWSTVMYATNPTYRAKTLAAQKRRKDLNNARNRERYASDETYREKRRAWCRGRRVNGNG